MNTPPKRTCPRCHRCYTDHPTLSRRDNATDICPDCGVEEAMIDAGFLKSGRAVADAALARDRRFQERIARQKED
jgi:hypothetical protein